VKFFQKPACRGETFLPAYIPTNSAAIQPSVDSANREAKYSADATAVSATICPTNREALMPTHCVANIPAVKATYCES
jgi:hypothetical protein